MEKKFRMTPRELILSNKDYSNFTKEELEAQYQIIMEQYNDFKNEMTINIDSKIINFNITNIKNTQKKIQQNMFDNMLNEVNNHIKIIEDLINNI